MSAPYGNGERLRSPKEGFKSGHEVDTDSYVFKATGVMARHPAAVTSCCFCTILLITIAGVLGGMLGITESSQYDWIISDSDASEELDALDDAIDRVDPIGGERVARTEISEDSKLYFIYETRDGSEVFDPEQLRDMCLAESLVAEDPRFVDFCRLKPGTEECELPTTSVVQLFYNFSSLDDWDCSVLLSESQVSNTASFLYAQAQTPEGAAEYGLYLSADWAARGFTPKTQSVFYLGAPRPGFRSVGTDSSDQFEEYQTFLSDDGAGVAGVEKSLFEQYDVDDNEDGFFRYYPSPYLEEVKEGNLEYQWWSLPMRETEFARLVTTDLNFAIFSVLFVLLYLRVHTGNCFVSVVGILQIFLSVPVGVVIYRGIYQIPFWQQLHTLVVFVILGIGADDIFVYVDAWKQTAATFGDGRDEETLHRRLNAAFVHTAQAVFNTSFTTAFAFIATGFSPLMPVATFGFYAATVVVLNYVFVMTLTPATVLVGEKYLGAECGSAAKARVAAALGRDSAGTRGSGAGADHKDEGGLAPPTPMNAAEQEEERFSNFFIEKMYIPFISFSVEVPWRDGRTVKFPLSASVLFFGLLGLAIFLTSRAVTLEPPEEQEEWFPSNHMFQRVENALTEDFLAADDIVYAEITVTWGISGIDRGDYNPYKPGDDRGTAEFDANYDLSHPSCQAAFLRACDDIETFSCGEDFCQPLGTIIRPDSLTCFMRDFQTWAQDTHGEDTLALASDAFYARLEEFRNTQLAADGSTYENSIGLIDGELAFATFSVTANMEFVAPTQDKEKMLDNYDAYLDLVRSYPECGPCSCSVTQVSDVWTQLGLELGLVRSFYAGLSISLPVAFGVLLLATGNAPLALLAIASVVFIVMGVLGFVSLLGWSLGVAESVAGVIVVGFSVDYTLHLAHVYEAAAEQGYSDRVSRFEYASRTMVVTVIAGAITTAGASLPLWGATLTFFHKMATLIVATIVLSYIYALGWFMSGLYLFGPEEDFGRLKLAERFAWLRERCRRN